MTDLRGLLDVIAATPFEHAEAEWRAVIDTLQLPDFYQPALVVALAQSDWRESSDVGRYLRTVTFRQAERLGLADLDGPPLLSMRTDENYDDALDVYMGRDDTDPYSSIYDRVGDALINNQHGIGVDWNRVAEKVALDSDECCVLVARSAGMTRAEILAELADDDEDRRALAAAYRRVTNKMPEIQAALAKKYFSRNLPQNRDRQVHRK
jgi:hypothetical protein